MGSSIPKVPHHSALVVTDIQNDFCPGGALAVAGGDAVVPIINAWIRAFRDVENPIAYTQDWHPPHHISFKERGGPWPPHCLQGSKGAELHPGLVVEGAVFRKGFDLDRDAYSGFEGRLVTPKGMDGAVSLAPWLRSHLIERLYIGGLTLDYCVKFSTLDSLREGFETMVILGATKAVNLRPGDGEEAKEKMSSKGAHFV